jgi:transposase
MIVIGVDVHKHSLTAVAVDEAGRLLEERTQACGDSSLLSWAAGLGCERLWALEDCRHVTGVVERLLLAAGEELVRVPPKLTGIARRGGRERGKSDAIDALAVARVALRDPDLARPRAGEERYRELKLLVVYRDDLIDERRRAQQRLRWHLHQIDASFVVPAGALDRTVWLERVGRWLSRRPRVVQVRLARDLVARCRSLSRMILELDRELETLSAQMAPALLQLPGCGGLTAAKLLAEIGPIERFASDAQLARHGGVAPLQASSGSHNDTASTAAATANSTVRSTASRSRKAASTHRHAPISSANKPKGKADAKRSAASNANSHAPSSTHSRTSPY